VSDTIPSPLEEVERRKKAATERYAAAAHAVQTGVAVAIHRGDQAASPKHLRVGVNSAMVDSGALARLLIEKRIISEVEYLEALALAMEEEQQRFEQKLGVNLA
jgi:hypothetical protein